MKAYILFQVVSNILKVPRIRHVSRSKSVRRHGRYPMVARADAGVPRHGSRSGTGTLF